MPGDAFDYLGVEESQAVPGADAWGKAPAKHPEGRRNPLIGTKYVDIWLFLVL